MLFELPFDTVYGLVNSRSWTFMHSTIFKGVRLCYLWDTWLHGFLFF